MDTPITTVALADDHKLFRSGIRELLGHFSGYRVIGDVGDGDELCRFIGSGNVPDIAIVDLNMPRMDGLNATKWLQKNFSQVKIIILSMSQDENTILRLLQAGVKGYLVKEADPEDFKNALDKVRDNDYYYPAYIADYLINRDKRSRSDTNPKLKQRETDFLELIATDLTYKEIAEKMNLSARTIDGYRDQMFDRFNVKSRVGLAIYAIKNKLIHI